MLNRRMHVLVDLVLSSHTRIVCFHHIPYHRWIKCHLLNACLSFCGAAGPANLTAGYRSSMNGLVLRAMDSVSKVNTLSVALLVTEGCALCLVAIMYIWILLQQVASQRYSLFAVFLVIPSAFLRALAAKKVSVSCAACHCCGICCGKPAATLKQ